MFLAIYGAVFFAGLAMMVREGMWSNAISLVNILISGLVAFGFYSPLAIYLDEMLTGQYTYLLDFLCIWALFVITMIVCSVMTGMMSKVRMRFKNPIDPVGGPVIAVVAAWLLAAFVTATLHTAPMPKDAFGGSLIHSDSEVYSKSVIFAPDLGWLRFVEHAFLPDALGVGDKPQFNAAGWVSIYAKHREQLDKAPGLLIRRG